MAEPNVPPLGPRGGLFKNKRVLAIGGGLGIGAVFYMRSRSKATAAAAATNTDPNAQSQGTGSYVDSSGQVVDGGTSGDGGQGLSTLPGIVYPGPVSVGDVTGTPGSASLDPSMFPSITPTPTDSGNGAQGSPVTYPNLTINVGGPGHALTGGGPPSRPAAGSKHARISAPLAAHIRSQQITERRLAQHDPAAAARERARIQYEQRTGKQAPVSGRGAPAPPPKRRRRHR